MASKNTGNVPGCGTILFLLLLLVLVIFAVKTALRFIVDNIIWFLGFGLLVVIVTIIIVVVKETARKTRNHLLSEIMNELNLKESDIYLAEFDDKVIVKSRQALDNYSDVKYFSENKVLPKVTGIVKARERPKQILHSFLINNAYKKQPQYDYVCSQLNNCKKRLDVYSIQIKYVTPAGNVKGEKVLNISAKRIYEFVSRPELLMTKQQYNQLLKQQSEEKLEAKKHSLTDRVNAILNLTETASESLIAKSYKKELEGLADNLYNNEAVRRIQNQSKPDSNNLKELETLISITEHDIQKIIQNDEKIRVYYESADFAKILESCSQLRKSQQEFNKYIDEKAQSIPQLLGKQVVATETQYEDTSNNIRPYKKRVTPFSVEVNRTAYGNAYNNQIAYVVKSFYPYYSQYREQIEKLRLLIEELETLNEAKDLINNYRKEFEQYICDVPRYVFENDEDGFYSRLGLVSIDESVLNIGYRIAYTSTGGRVQQAFTVPMNEENITELIHCLESKLSAQAFEKEQRALMTSKLRNHIKERDNYTCRLCGNSVFAEPNLLLEIDHITPVSKGGLTQEDNLQTLCWRCNRNKG